MVDGVVRSRSGTGRRVAAVLAAAAVLSGCEQLAKLASGSSTASQPPAATQPAGAGQPAPSCPTLPTPLETDVVATVNGRAITTRDVEDAVLGLKTAIQARGESWEPLPAEPLEGQDDLTDVLDNLIRAELMAQDAVSRGLDREARVQHAFWSLHRTFFSQEWARDQGVQITVTPEQIDEFYNKPENQWFFRRPERIRVRQLVVASEQEAKAALVKLLEGLSMEEVARQMALPGRLDAAQGDVVQQWVMRAVERRVYAADDPQVRDFAGAQQLEDAAFAIPDVGAVSSIVKGPDAYYHIFQLAERKPPVVQSQAEVQDVIRNILTVQQFNDKVRELEDRSQSAIQRHPERLHDVVQ